MDYLEPYAEVKDYNLQFKVRNGPMLEAMRKSGYPSARQLWLACGVSEQTIGRYLNLSYPPMTKAGKFHRTIKTIAKCLGTHPELLFPQQHLTEALKKNEGEVNLNLQDIEELTGKLLIDGPEVLMLEGEKIDKLVEAMDCLTAKERRVIEGRFYLPKLKSLEELGTEFEVSRERIRQIETIALNKMKKRLTKIYTE